MQAIDPYDQYRFSGCNLVVITLDCVRPDFLGCYGCRSVQTPTLDKLAGSGVVLEQAISQAPNTWVSHAGIFTGLYPPRHGLHRPFDRIRPEVGTLASILAENGYGCAGFPGNDLVGSRMGFQKGFDLYFEDYDRADPEPSGINANNRNVWEDVIEAAASWLSGQKNPFFAWFHYLDTHHLPEVRLPDYYRFSREPLWQFYEGKISYADERCLGRILELLQRMGRAENTLFVILSDHGEGLRPGMPPSHNGMLTEEVIRVPMILAGEPLPWKGVRIPGLVRTVDLMPTLVRMLCRDNPASLDGLPEFSGGLLPLPGLERGSPGKPFPGHIAYAENEPMGLFCVISEEWKLVKEPERDVLFHLPSDPNEEENVLYRHPETAEHLRQELDSIRKSGCSETRVLAEREEEETRRLLRSFGYIE